MLDKWKNSIAPNDSSGKTNAERQTQDIPNLDMQYQRLTLKFSEPTYKEKSYYNRFFFELYFLHFQLILKEFETTGPDNSESSYTKSIYNPLALKVKNIYDKIISQQNNSNEQENSNSQGSNLTLLEKLSFIKEHILKKLNDYKTIVGTLDSQMTSVSTSSTEANVSTQSSEESNENASGDKLKKAYIDTMENGFNYFLMLEAIENSTGTTEKYYFAGLGAYIDFNYKQGKRNIIPKIKHSRNAKHKLKLTHDCQYFEKDIDLVMRSTKQFNQKNKDETFETFGVHFHPGPQRLENSVSDLEKVSSEEKNEENKEVYSESTYL